MRTYVADFETTTDPADCRVWAWSICNIATLESDFGIFISTFLSELEGLSPARVYFHNLAFDASFLMDYLERSGWRWVDGTSELEPYCYSTVISDMNQVYSVALRFADGSTVKLYDSLKLIPMPVRSVAKAFGLPEGKGELDYEAYREPGHALTEVERDYIRRDVEIVARAMKVLLDEGDDKMTAGSCALADYKRMMGGHRRFRKWFPVLAEQDAFLRRSYKGGWCYADPRFAGRILGCGLVFDVNSLYPSVMAATDGQALPFGEPKWFDGRPEPTKAYPLWVAQVCVRFNLKSDHVPCIQLKNNPRFRQTEYLSSSRGEVVITVTSVDWELYNSQYDVEVIEWFGGFAFKASTHLFEDYVWKWVEVKNNATRSGNKGMRMLAKLRLNSLYGKMATRCTVRSRRPVLENGVLRYVDLPEEEREPVYLPAGTFITAHARFKTVSAAQSVYGRFAYADTDSIHITGEEVPEGLDVDDVRLGAWKHESTFERAKFIRPKCYAEEVGDALTVHICGMPDSCHDQVTLENLDFGAVYSGKLYQKRVAGGIVLEPGTMEIRR